MSPRFIPLFEPAQGCREGPGDCMKTVELLLEETGLSAKDLAESAGLPLDRVEAIVDGRWTPSPEERAKVAAALGLSVDEVSWGHTMNPRNVRYRRFGLKENF